jgi:hypothetical protein
VIDKWRTPVYRKLDGTFIDKDGLVCLSVDDAKRVVANQVMCESIRKEIIQFLDDVNNSF